MRDRLERVAATLAAAPFAQAPATIVCVPRHGHGTAKVTVESVYTNTRTDFVMIYVDPGSPAVVRRYLEEQAAARPNFLHVRVDEPVSRQTARLLVLDLVRTRWTVFLDNNMLVRPDWLGILLRAAERDAADVVSPFIVMQGGRVHFSGSTLTKNDDGTIRRSQNIADCRLGTRLEEATPRKMEIDFGESHCCLVSTAGFAGALEDVFPEDMHNSHTLGYGTYVMKTEHGRKMTIEPEALVSILPVGFGYDMPWLFESYNDLDCFRRSYALYGERIGRGFSTTLENLRWHRKHLLYLLLSMLDGDRLARETLLEPDEVPAYVEGYDLALPDDAPARVEAHVLPWVARNHPALAPPLAMWLRGDVGVDLRLEDHGAPGAPALAGTTNAAP